MRRGPVEPVAWARFDTEATAFLKQVISDHGWPGRSLVGADGAQAAWLLAQHSPDLTFQEEVLGILQGLPDDEVPPVDAAYLLDRICIRRGQPQVYGTQLGPDGQPFPIGDAAGVEARRRAVGLEPLAASLAQFGPG